MKIGIITTYDEINFGAYLQAYSLSEKLKAMGHEVLFVNYKSKRYFIAELKATFGTRNPVYFLRIVLKYIKFRKQINKLVFSKKLRKIKQIDELPVDLFVYGSDEIWNFTNCLGGVIDPYYFGFGVNKSKISYAPSLGNSSFIPSDFIQNFKNFKAISVRDHNSKKVLEESLNFDVSLVLDPTFLIDIKSTNYKINEDYIAYYCVNHDDNFIKEINEFAKSVGLIVLSLGYKSKKFKNIISIDPFEWVYLIQNAKFVFTDMFHGTIFSIKNKKKFLVNLTEYRQNKLGFLLESLECNSRIYQKGKLMKQIEIENDYRVVDNAIKVRLKLSNEFLIKNIDN